LKSKGQSKKLAKLLGEDFTASQAGPAPFASIPPPPSVPAFLSPPETPWYLGDDYAPADIVIDDKGQVRGGTLPALVARLTPHGATGMSREEVD
jgi:son of sevenless-like protein